MSDRNVTFNAFLKSFTKSRIRKELIKNQFARTLSDVQYNFPHAAKTQNIELKTLRGNSPAIYFECDNEETVYFGEKLKEATESRRSFSLNIENRTIFSQSNSHCDNINSAVELVGPSAGVAAAWRQHYSSILGLQVCTRIDSCYVEGEENGRQQQKKKLKKNKNISKENTPRSSSSTPVHC